MCLIALGNLPKEKKQVSKKVNKKFCWTFVQIRAWNIDYESIYQIVANAKKKAAAAGGEKSVGETTNTTSKDSKKEKKKNASRLSDSSDDDSDSDSDNSDSSDSESENNWALPLSINYFQILS